MAIEIRAAREDEMDQYAQMGAYSFAGVFGDGPDNVMTQSSRAEWTLCAFDGPVMATSFLTFPFTMRANGNAVAFAGVSGVGTHPQYRRQGLLRRIMTQSFGNMRDAGQTVAGLWASQAAIYQRYGYAMLGSSRTYSVDTVDIQFHDGDFGSMQVRRMSPTDAMDSIKAVYREFIAERMGYLHRSQPLWAIGTLAEVEKDGPAYVAVAYDGEIPRGYAVYTNRANRHDHPARGQAMNVRDFISLDGNAYRSLWGFIARHDLVGKVVWSNVPADDPAPDIFLEPRLLNTRESETSWFRVIDVPSALTQRGYDGAGEIDFAIVDDGLADWNNGTWRLTADPTGAVVQPTSAAPKVTMNIKALSALYTGSRSARALANWNMIDADDATIATLDRLFATKYAPHCADNY
jgi:predicted acetyltransferase